MPGVRHGAGGARGQDGHVKRRAIHFLTGFSLLLWLAVAATWAGSYRRVLTLTYFRPWSDGARSIDENTTAGVSRGTWYVQSFRADRWRSDGAMPPDQMPPGTTGAWSVWMRRQPDQQFAGSGDKRFAGFVTRHDRSRDRGGGSVETLHAMNMVLYGIPSWALLLTTAGLPAASAAAWWRRRNLARRRRSAGLCAGCGYDLRATPGRCPECGEGAAAGAAAIAV
jgi:hypothetical protein